MMSGNTVKPDFPLPWAAEASDNFLLTADEIQSMLEEHGFTAEYFVDASDTQFNPVMNTQTSSVPQVNLSLSAYVNNLGQKPKTHNVL